MRKRYLGLGTDGDKEKRAYLSPENQLLCGGCTFTPRTVFEIKEKIDLVNWRIIEKRHPKNHYVHKGKINTFPYSVYIDSNNTRKVKIGCTHFTLKSFNQICQRVLEVHPVQ